MSDPLAGPDHVFRKYTAARTLATYDALSGIRVESLNAQPRGHHDVDIKLDQHILYYWHAGNVTNTWAWIDGRAQSSSFCTAGSFSLLPKERHLQAEIERQGQRRYLAFILSADDIRRDLNEEGIDGDPELLVQMNWRDPMLSHAAEQVSRAVTIVDPLTRLQTDIFRRLVLVRMADKWSARQQPRTVNRGGLSPGALARACERMLDDMNRSVGLADLAATAGVSEGHFLRGFKQSTGMTPHRWLVARRIDRARTLLADRKLTLTDVALAVGYGSQSAFGYVFRRETGHTPSAYRSLVD